MAHRYNPLTERKEPKPNSNERTKFRWRTRHGIESELDKLRLQQREETKESIKEKAKQKLANLAAAQALMQTGMSLLGMMRGKKRA